MYVYLQQKPIIMYMNKWLFSMALASLSTTLMAQNAHQWTLKECIDYAVANNISLKKKTLAKQSAAEDVKQAKAQLLPSLNASTTQSLGFRPWPNESTGMVSNGTVQRSVDKLSYNGTYGINANWTVWNGNKNHNTLKLNKLTEEQAAADSAVTAKTIEEQITQLYVQILYTNEAVQVNKYSYETSLANEKRGEEMVKVGKMSKADLAQLQSQTAADKYSIVETQSSLAKYKSQLKQLLEITNEGEFNVAVPETTDEQATATIPGLTAVYENAVNNRPEIVYSQLGIKQSNLNIAIAKAGWMPTVSLTGSAMTSSSSMNDNSWGNQIKTNFDIAVGATLSMPIYDQRQTKTAVNKAKIQRDNAMLELEDKKKQIWNSVEGYWIDANNNQQKFIAAKQNVESAETSYALMSEQFKLGLKNIIELMNSKTNLLKAQQDMLQSKYMTILAKEMLELYNK